MPQRRQRQQRRSRKATARARRQVGGMLPGLFLGMLKAKKRNKKFNVGNYLKNSFVRRFNVAKVAAGKKVPTPENTGMSRGSFWKSALFGLG